MKYIIAYIVRQGMDGLCAILHHSTNIKVLEPFFTSVGDGWNNSSVVFYESVELNAKSKKEIGLDSIQNRSKVSISDLKIALNCL